jgi:hypothetical protein
MITFPWLRDPGSDLEILGVEALCFRRNVSDGRLTALVALEPHGWHLSISFASHRGAHTRYPSFDEIADARYQLLPAEITVAMILPPPEEYVALHMTTFHLHEIDTCGRLV